MVLKPCERRRIQPPFVQVPMREGKITNFCERGGGDGAGQYRLTSLDENRRFRLIVDEGGNVIRRSMIDFGDRQLLTSVRKPGG